MNCKSDKYPTTVFTAPDRKIDPRKLLGVAIYGGVVESQTLTLPAKISEKVRMQIPVMQITSAEPITMIKSLQMKNGLMVAEIAGPLTPMVRQVIGAIVRNMANMHMVTAFFPGGTAAKEQAQYYYGTSINTLELVNDQTIGNIRLLDNGEGLLFTQQNKLMRLSTAQINGNWAREASKLYEFGQRVRFLGRVQENTVAATLANNETPLLVTISQAKAVATDLSAFRQKMTAVLGHMRDTSYSVLAGLTGQELVVIPAPSR